MCTALVRHTYTNLRCAGIQSTTCSTAAGNISAERFLLRYRYPHGHYSFFMYIPLIVFCLVWCTNTYYVLVSCFNTYTELERILRWFMQIIYMVVSTHPLTLGIVTSAVALELPIPAALASAGDVYYHHPFPQLACAFLFMCVFFIFVAVFPRHPTLWEYVDPSNHGRT